VVGGRKKEGEKFHTTTSKAFAKRGEELKKRESERMGVILANK